MISDFYFYLSSLMA